MIKIKSLVAGLLLGAFFIATAFAQSGQLSQGQVWGNFSASAGPAKPTPLMTFPVVSGNLACFNGTTGRMQDCGSAPNTYTPPWSGAQAYSQSTLNANVVYATDFLGAKTCDGVTNVFTELQAFLTIMSANGAAGKSVTGIFPPGECILDSASSLTLTINSSGGAVGYPVNYHLMGYGSTLTPAIARATSGLIIARGTLSNHGDEQTGATVEGLSIKQRNNANALFGFEVNMPHVKLIRNQVYAGDDNGVHNQVSYIGIYYHQKDRNDSTTGPFYGRIEENSIKGTNTAGGSLPIAMAIEGSVNALVIRANSISQVNYGILVSNPCAAITANCAYISSGAVVTENSIESTTGSAIRFATSVPTISNLTGWQMYGNRFENITIAALDLAQITQQSPYPSSFGPNTYLAVGAILSNANNIALQYMPNLSGTYAISASSPLVINATTGNATCATCVTSSGGGPITGTAPIVVSAAGVVSITPGQIPGTATNDNASAGNVGEYIESVIPSGSAVSLATTIPINMTSISLTAGDWDVDGVCNFTGNVATTVAYISCGVSTTTGTLDQTKGRVSTTPFFSNPVYNNVPSTIATQPVIPVRFSLASTTTIFVVAQSSFATNVSSVWGLLRARRPR